MPTDRCDRIALDVEVSMPTCLATTAVYLVQCLLLLQHAVSAPKPSESVTPHRVSIKHAAFPSEQPVLYTLNQIMDEKGYQGVQVGMKVEVLAKGVDDHDDAGEAVG